MDGTGPILLLSQRESHGLVTTMGLTRCVVTSSNKTLEVWSFNRTVLRLIGRWGCCPLCWCFPLGLVSLFAFLPLLSLGRGQCRFVATICNVESGAFKDDADRLDHTMYVAITFGTIFQGFLAHVLTAFKSEPTGVALVLVNRHSLTSSKTNSFLCGSYYTTLLVKSKKPALSPVQASQSYTRLKSGMCLMRMTPPASRPRTMTGRGSLSSSHNSSGTASMRAMVARGG
jgi:hypothetical protein